MSRGKHLSLEEARTGANRGATIDRFCKEHPIEDVHPRARSRFKSVLDAMAKGSLEGEKTSGRVVSEGYSGTQTRQDTSEDAGD